MKDGVLVAVERKRYAFAPKSLHHDGYVAFQCFGWAEGGRDDFPGGVIDDAVQGKLRAAILQPGEGGSINLPQHARLRFTGPRSVSLWTTAQACGTKAAFQQNAADRRDAKADVLVFGQKLGKVGGIASEVAIPVQGHHALFERVGQGVNGLSAPIPMSDGLCTSVTIFGLEPIRLPDADAERARNILFRETALHPLLDNHSTFQFALRQGDLLPVHTDIFTEQLHPDNITEQQHRTAHFACFSDRSLLYLPH